MAGFDDLIYDKLAMRGLQKKEADTIVNFVRQIEDGVKSIKYENLSNEPELVFVTTTIE